MILIISLFIIMYIISLHLLSVLIISKSKSEEKETDHIIQTKAHKHPASAVNEKDRWICCVLPLL